MISQVIFSWLGSHAPVAIGAGVACGILISAASIKIKKEDKNGSQQDRKKED